MLHLQFVIALTLTVCRRSFKTPVSSCALLNWVCIGKKTTEHWGEILQKQRNKNDFLSSTWWFTVLAETEYMEHEAHSSSFISYLFSFLYFYHKRKYRAADKWDEEHTSRVPLVWELCHSLKRTVQVGSWLAGYTKTCSIIKYRGELKVLAGTEGLCQMSPAYRCWCHHCHPSQQPHSATQSSKYVKGFTSVQIRWVILLWLGPQVHNESRKKFSIKANVVRSVCNTWKLTSIST